MEVDFDEQCRMQRLKNEAMLKELGLDVPMLPPKKKAGKPRAPRKRKAAAINSEEEASDAEPPSKKVARSESTDSGENSIGLRRSGRNRGRAVDYKDGANTDNARLPRLASVQAGLKLMNSSINKRIHDPYVVC